MSLAQRLRELAEHLPAGGSLTITRDALFELAAAESADGSDHSIALPELTVPELAERFRRSPSTIRDWCEHGRFEGAFKLNGRDSRIPQAAVDAFVAQQHPQPRASPVSLSAWRAIRRTE